MKGKISNEAACCSQSNRDHHSNSRLITIFDSTQNVFCDLEYCYSTEYSNVKF